MYTSYNQGVCNNLMVSSVHLLHIHYVNLLDDVINASKQQSSIWPDQVNNVPTHYAVSMHTDLVVSSIHLHIMQSVCTLTWCHHQWAYILCSQYADWPDGVVDAVHEGGHKGVGDGLSIGRQLHGVVKKYVRCVCVKETVREKKQLLFYHIRETFLIW